MKLIDDWAIFFRSLKDLKGKAASRLSKAAFL
jgi:hypothetical protein